MDTLRTMTLQTTLTPALRALRDRLSGKVALGKVAVIVTDMNGAVQFNLTLDGSETDFVVSNNLSRLIAEIPVNTHNQRVCALLQLAAAAYALVDDSTLVVDVTYQVVLPGATIKDFVVQQYQSADGKLAVNTPIVLDQTSAE